ncbi:hypothetical protein EDB85DRAFT_2178159, partial [Lactarius pseudohatsudake]
AITKDTAGKSRTATVQILDYNLNRFDIADCKGLEIALLTTLLTIQDMAAANNTPADPVILAPPVQPEAPPTPPSRPAPNMGVNRIAEMHAMRYEPNEVTVNEEGSIEDYGEYVESLLADDAMTLFITVRFASPADVSRVYRSASPICHLRRRAARPATYTPPTSLTMHLSKIPMPELCPPPVTP